MAKKKTSQKKGAAPMAEPLMESNNNKETVQRDPSPDRTEKLKQLNEILLKQTVEKREQVSQLKTQIDDMGLDFEFVSETEREVFRVVLSAFVINLSIETHERLRVLEGEKAREIEKNRVLMGEKDREIEKIRVLEGEKEREIEKSRVLEGEKEREIEKSKVLKGELEREIEKTKVLMGEKEKQIAKTRDLEGRVEGLKGEKEKEIEKSKVLEERIEGLKGELKDEMERKRLVETERIEVLGKLDIKGKEVLELGKIVKELEREKLGLQGEIIRVCEERDGLVGDKQGKDGVICNLRNEKGVIEKRLEECQILVEKLKIKIEEEIKEKEIKLGFFVNEKEGLEKKIFAMKREHGEAASKLGSEIEGLNCKNTEKDREIGDLKETIDGKNENIEGLKKEIEILQLAIEEAKKKGFWSWIYPAATTVLAAVSFVYATRAR